jgi:hypothetical protein
VRQDGVKAHRTGAGDGRFDLTEVIEKQQVTQSTIEGTGIAG